MKKVILLLCAYRYCVSYETHTHTAGAVFGDSKGKEGVHKVTLENFSQAEVTEDSRKNDTPEKLAIGLLLQKMN